MGAFAGDTQAEDRDAAPHKAVHHVYKQRPAPVAEGHLMRIPEHPTIRDCVHVFFPQCSPRGGYDPLNDGTYGGSYNNGGGSRY
jgi:hypothetical protein